MRSKRLLFIFLPILAFFALILVNPKDISNKRVNLDAVSVYKIDSNYKSKLVSKEYKIETKESIKKLETETLSEPTTTDYAVKETDTITVAYRGWRANDGVIFDSSLESKPVDGRTFKLAGLIPGWKEGIAGMKPGEVRRIFVPSELGYGENGSGELIPANTDLIFDVELLGIN